MDKTDRLRDHGLAFLLYEQGLGVCGYELIRELFIFIKLILYSYLYNERIILLLSPLLVVPTECTDHTEAYGLKLFESTEWPTLRDARIHRNECLRRHMRRTMLNLGDATQAINSVPSVV